MALTLRSSLTTLVLGGVVAAVAACSGAQASELGATCEEFAATPTISQSVELSVAQDLSVALCSNPSTGFSWEDATIGDPAVLTLVSQAYGAPAEASLPIVGRAGGEVVKLRANAAGTTAVSLRYSRPWVGGEKGEWTYELTVTVR